MEDIDIELYQLWVDNIKDYSVLNFILTELKGKKHTDVAQVRKRIYAILTDLSLNLPLNLPLPLITTPPGIDYEIYKSIIGANPQPIPELKNYPEDIANKLSTHPCWIDWAAIYDRKLTQGDRLILNQYREVYIKFLYKNDFKRAKNVLNLATFPFSLNLINLQYLYSKKIITELLL
jgi:hypothetical protein